MKKSILLALLFGLLFNACDDVASGTTTNTSNTTTVNAQLGEPEKNTSTTTKAVSPQDLEKVGQVVAFSSFNKKIATAGDDAWTTSPFQIALKFGGDQMETRKKVISAESLSGGENFNKLLMTIEEDGLLDDSIKGSMLILRLEKSNGKWQVNKASRVWKCYPNRGHLEYNSTPCS